jgi:hypothetical protein
MSCRCRYRCGRRCRGGGGGWGRALGGLDRLGLEVANRGGSRGDQRSARRRALLPRGRGRRGHTRGPRRGRHGSCWLHCGRRGCRGLRRRRRLSGRRRQWRVASGRSGAAMARLLVLRETALHASRVFASAHHDVDGCRVVRARAARAHEKHGARVRRGRRRLLCARVRLMHDTSPTCCLFTWSGVVTGHANGGRRLLRTRPKRERTGAIAPAARRRTSSCSRTSLVCSSRKRCTPERTIAASSRHASRARRAGARGTLRAALTGHDLVDKRHECVLAARMLEERVLPCWRAVNDVKGAE